LSACIHAWSAEQLYHNCKRSVLANGKQVVCDVEILSTVQHSEQAARQHDGYYDKDIRVPMSMIAIDIAAILRRPGRDTLLLELRLPAGVKVPLRAQRMTLHNFTSLLLRNPFVHGIPFLFDRFVPCCSFFRQGTSAPSVDIAAKDT
jgi:hypothetical protein